MEVLEGIRYNKIFMFRSRLIGIGRPAVFGLALNGSESVKMFSKY